MKDDPKHSTIPRPECPLRAVRAKIVLSEAHCLAIAGSVVNSGHATFLSANRLNVESLLEATATAAPELRTGVALNRGALLDPQLI